MASPAGHRRYWHPQPTKGIWIAVILRTFLTLKTDSPSGEGSIPFRLIFLVEDDVFFASRGGPGPGAKLSIKLSGAPTRITQDEEHPTGPGPSGYRSEDVNLRGDCEPSIYVKRVRGRVVVGMQHDDQGPPHRPALVEAHGTDNPPGVQAGLLKQRHQWQIAERMIHDEADGSAGVVTHHVDDGVVEVGIMELGGCHEQLARETHRFRRGGRRAA